MSKLTVDVVTPERKVLSVQADEVVVPGVDGLFGVRPRHAALLANLGKGTLTLKAGGAVTHSYKVAGGFAQVANDVVRILADKAEPLS
jgi:F-type H+-transporting ATPase subunit epsilon